MAEDLIEKLIDFKDDSSFVPATLHSLAVILITEIGDKTFFIAAVLAMRYGRLVVYSGAMAALALMHVLSAVMGFALPSLLPKLYTHYASTLLFFYFGLRLLKDAYDAEGSGPSEELQEVEEELIKKKDSDKVTSNDDETEETYDRDIEAHSKDSNFSDNNSMLINSPKKPVKVSSYNQTNANLKVFSQAFTLTFLAEWGDRSQIATIALAASKNPLGVVLGGLIGHAFCTGLAVIGGRLLASRISEKHVALVGGILFIVFGIHGMIVGPED